jgi:hypothetical protein
MDFDTLALLKKGDEGREMTLLPEDFHPGDYDVIFGRGRRIFQHAGNEHFRHIVSQ